MASAVVQGCGMFQLRQGLSSSGLSLPRLWRYGLAMQQKRGAKTKKQVGSDKKREPIPSGPPQANMEVCEGANIYKTGSDPALKEDSAYPRWLWSITDSTTSQTELSLEDKLYWRRMNKMKAHERNLLQQQSSSR